MSKAQLLRLWAFCRGPRLFRLHRRSSRRPAEDYSPGILESRSQFVITILSSFHSMLYYSTPLLILYCYRNDFFTKSGLVTMGVFTGTVSVVFLFAMIGRMMGRLSNPEYVAFMGKMDAYELTKDRTSLKQLKEYDFSFDQFPAEFELSVKEKERQVYRSKHFGQKLYEAPGMLNKCTEFFAYMVAHSFGIRLVYPGSTALVQNTIGSVMTESRAKLIEKQGGRRGKLISADGNFIDTMLIDRRPKLNENGGGTGNILVVCCEGNAGFYEVGCMSTPMLLGYSVLGWNHPGFGSSTGQPFPDAEKNAIYIVMQYATTKLKYRTEDIYVFAWSIGGYTAINAAAMYPNIKGLILDATFHDIIPFGDKMMPSCLNGLMTYTVRNYINLWNSKYLQSYNGDVIFIRRTKDEVMNIDGVEDVKSNLGNLLIEDFLWTRYPQLFDKDSTKILSKRGKSDEFDALWQWIRSSDNSGRELLLRSWGYDEEWCMKEIETTQKRYPEWNLYIGRELESNQKVKMIAFFLSKYVVNYDSVHCTPLPSRYFRLPWHHDYDPSTASQHFSTTEDTI